MKSYKLILTIFLLSGFFWACTDLDETPLDQISESQFNQNEVQVAASVRGIYESLLEPHDFRVMWFLQEVPTEIGITPVRGGGWAGDGEQKYKQHTWDSSDLFILQMYQWFGKTIGRANSLLENLEEESAFESYKAETRFYRAWAYFNLLDLYGNVPIVSSSFEDPSNLAGNKPISEQRKKVFDFVEEDLIGAITNLPGRSNVDNGYYPRPTKQTAQAVLAKLYLNAQVWSGEARWQDCINTCNEIINSGTYALTPNISDSYVPNNENSPEIMWSILKSSAGTTRADGNFINQLAFQPELSEVFNLPWSGWGGNSIGIEHYQTYEDNDYRKSLILFGPQYDSNGNEVINIKEITDLFDAQNEEGLKSIKYVPDLQQNGAFANNDIVLLRYADILLSKAECLIRLNGSGAGDDLINQVRQRNFQTYTPLVNVGLDDLLVERGREFFHDNLRRQDLVRFGKFINQTYKFKLNSDSFRTIYPLPQQEVDVNPNLDQNPNY